MANKTLHHKKELLGALEKCKCIVTDACKLVGVSRQTYYDYYNNDDAFKDSVDELANVALDFGFAAGPHRFSAAASKDQRSPRDAATDPTDDMSFGGVKALYR